MVSCHLPGLHGLPGRWFDTVWQSVSGGKQLLSGGDMTQEESGMSKREWRELMVSWAGLPTRSQIFLS